MNQSKFRIWDKIDERYLGDNSLIDIGGHTFTFKADNFSDKFLVGHLEPKADYEVIVEKCTGEQDVDGTLIYEGDIVRHGSYVGIVAFGHFNENSRGNIGFWINLSINMDLPADHCKTISKSHIGRYARLRDMRLSDYKCKCCRCEYQWEVSEEVKECDG